MHFPSGTQGGTFRTIVLRYLFALVVVAIGARNFGCSADELCVADSVASALRWAEAETFDVVVSDIGLPDGSGWDLIR